jgi:tRNA threonylcarbamoyladenosine biosynthesis protein TsaE
MQHILQIKTAIAMQNLGKKIARICPDGMVIYLRGELGAGKTTFVRGFLRGLNYLGRVRSPTFTLIEFYDLPVVKKQIYHFDLYRLNDPDELELLGVRDYFSPHSICLVEWPEKGAEKLAPPDLSIAIDFATDGRTVVLLAKNVRGEEIIRQLS